MVFIVVANNFLRLCEKQHALSNSDGFCPDKLEQHNRIDNPDRREPGRLLGAIG